jgi:hypothetical protein
MLNLAAVADVEGLEEEVAVLRASIRELAKIEDVAEHVKVLAELRHQIEALCTTLKTKDALAARAGSGRQQDLERILDELGDDLGVTPGAAPRSRPAAGQRPGARSRPRSGSERQAAERSAPDRPAPRGRRGASDRLEPRDRVGVPR